MQQLALFETKIEDNARFVDRTPLDMNSERLLARFQNTRVSTGANPNSVRRDLSQLRSLVRISMLQGGPSTLDGLFGRFQDVAEALKHPSSQISRSTGQARLRAAQRFIAFMRNEAGATAVTTQLQELDLLLPARTPRHWHDAGVVVTGSVLRRRRQGPVLDPSDLEAIVDAAKVDRATWLACRDTALVALHCFSGLRTEEIVALEWAQIGRIVTRPGRANLSVRVTRDGICLELPVFGQACDALLKLSKDRGTPLDRCQGRVFRAMKPPCDPLSDRMARKIVRNACLKAGFPGTEACNLRATFAFWLRTQGWTDHQIARVLGIKQVRSVDRLLRRHKEIEAQRLVAREATYQRDTASAFPLKDNR